MTPSIPPCSSPVTHSHYLLLSAMCFAQSLSPSHLLLSHRPIHLCPFSSPYTHGVLKAPPFLPDLTFKSTLRVPSLPPPCRTVLSVFSLPGDPASWKNTICNFNINLSTSVFLLPPLKYKLQGLCFVQYCILSARTGLCTQMFID